MCSHGLVQHHHLHQRSDHARFAHPTRPAIRSPQSIFFRTTRPGGPAPLRSSLNDTVSVSRFLDPSMSLYELLGIPETGSLLEIKQAYKQLARKYHPDVSPPGRVEEYTQRFIMVQEAYETLSDPRMRELYDRGMARGIHVAFDSARHRRRSSKIVDEEMENRSDWKSRWQSQLSELKKRSMHKNSSSDDHNNMSWAARMRRERNNDASS